MSTVERFVNQRVKEIAMEEQIAPEPPVRFSVNINHDLNFRLQFLAQTLEETRASLASKFIEMAIVDAEKTLGLNPFDFESEYSKKFIEATGGIFYQDETGLYRELGNGERVLVVDPNNEDEIDYSLGKKDDK